MESDGRTRPVHLPPNERHNTPIIVYVTVCTKNRKRILADRIIHNWLRETWQVNTSWLMGKYMIMPDHIHFFCAPGELHPPPLAGWIKFWKSHAARLWPHAEQAPVWQREAWDTQLRRHESYDSKWEYVSTNPVRAGLVRNAEDWPYQGELNELRW
jgi:putative transposase